MFKNVIYMHSLAKKDTCPNKIDATIGVLLDDNKKLVYSTIFDNAFKSFDGELYNYAPVSGGEEYQNSIRTYFEIPEEYSVVASPGATGALSMLMIAKKQNKNLMLVPSLAWTNYNSMAKTFNYDVINYANRPLSVDTSVFKDYDNIFVIINTPASNPVGSTYTKEELDEFIGSLEDFDNVKFVFCGHNDGTAKVKKIVNETRKISPPGINVAMKSGLVGPLTSRPIPCYHDLP